MADLTFYNLSMTGEEADGGIRVGMDIGALNGIPYSNGNGGILVAVPGEDYGYPLLRGYGPPTANTAASFGQHYYDLSATKPPFEYICIAFTETNGFVWRQHNDAGYFQATYGATSYQDIIKNYNLGKVCIVVDSNNDIYYLGQVDTNQLTFYHAFRNVSSAQDGARIEYKNVRVTSTNTWSRFFYYGENTANRTQIINEQSTDAQYPSARAVYTYGQAIGAAAKDYTDTQLEPVAAAAGKAEDYALKAYVTPTASGSIASFDDGAEDIPVKSLVVDIEPVQSGSGDPSPENVRPISGWTGVKVQRSGKNLVPRMVVGMISGATGELIAGATDYASSDYIQVVPGESYTISQPSFSAPSGGGSHGVAFYNSSKEFLSYIGLISGGIILPQTFTPPSSAVYARFRIFYGSGAGLTTPPADVMCELGSTATAYEPYQGDTYDISFPDEVGTVYGGTLDVTNGVLTVDRAMVDIGALTWYVGVFDESHYAFLTINSGLPALPKPSSSATDAGNLLCEKYKSVSWANIYNRMTGVCVMSSVPTLQTLSLRAYDAIYFSDELYPTDADKVAAFKADNAGIKLVYEMYEPLTYQLDPIEVSTLLGVNNIYADTGDTEVTYRADPTLIYNKLTAAIISSSGTV